MERRTRGENVGEESKDDGNWYGEDCRRDTGGVMTTAVAEMRYDEDGRQGNRADMAANKCNSRDLGQRGQ